MAYRRGLDLHMDRIYKTFLIKIFQCYKTKPSLQSQLPISIVSGELAFFEAPGSSEDRVQASNMT
jgi:hypothetical protein